MSKVKHTKGPWRVGAVQPGRFPVYPVWGPGGEYVAEVQIRADNEAGANARLIAAAPCLLDACKAVLSSPRLGDEPSPEAIEMVCAAIAKAEGQ